MGFSWVDRAQGLRGRMSAAALTGALWVAAFPAFDIAWLAWVCLVPALWALDDDRLRGRDALGLGLVMGLVVELGTTGWVYHALRHGAALSAGWSLGGFLGLCTLQALPFAVWGWAVHRLRRGGHMVALTGPLLFVLVEWLGLGLAAFPAFLANTQYKNLLLVQSLDLWGPLGIDALLAATSGVVYLALAWAARRRGPRPFVPALVAALVVGATFVYGALVVQDVEDTADHPGAELRVGVVQPGSRRGLLDATLELRRAREQSLEVIRQGADLVVWPESSYAEAIRDGAAGPGADLARGIGRPLLFGGLRLEPVEGARRRLFSTAFLIDAHGKLVGSYDRHHLFALKDYVPLGALVPALYDVLPHGVRLDAGTRPATLDVDGIKVAVVMSFEELSPRYVRKVMADGADLLVSMSDGWLAQGRGPAVQLALATFRAVEHRRFVVRATPAGLSAVIDPTGRVVSSASLGARANVVVSAGAMSGRTLYEVMGDWPALVCLAAVLVWLRAPAVALLGRLRRAPLSDAARGRVRS